MGMNMQIAGLFLNVMAMSQQRRAAEMQARAYEEQGKLAEIQAGQQEIERNRRLRMQLASLDTTMAGRGVAIGTSSSTEALAVDEERMALADISAIKLMGMSERRKYQLSASSSRAKGQAATISAFAKMGGSIYDTQVGPGANIKRTI
tara:strand:- start:905 stop:1348 length:444 start_codon:yes stop_codon:yes gene_type:complete